MRRKFSSELKNWFDQSGSKPLILRGARQVGKSTLVRLFCHQEKIDLLEVNFEKIKLREIENSKSFTVQKLIQEIELVCGKKVKKNTLIFFDEIQAQPMALNRLRYFYEDAPEVRIIAAGSLLEVMLEKEKFSMPVGRVQYVFLGPMSFMEFLDACDEKILLEQLENSYQKKEFSLSLHEKCIEKLREYYFVGGMPEAVLTFVKTRDFVEVRRVQNDLIQTYKDDIPKYSSPQTYPHLSDVFDSVSSVMGQAKVSYAQLSDKPALQIKNAIKLLDQAQIIMRVSYSNASGVPLAATTCASAFKLYYLDIGLFNAITGLQFQELTKKDDLMTKGVMAEQFIAQHLKYLDPHVKNELYYWLRGGSKKAAEVDFLFNLNGSLLPIEVKSGTTGNMRSLWQLVSEKKIKRALRFDLLFREHWSSPIHHEVVTERGVEKINCVLTSLPIYAVEGFQSFFYSNT